MKSDRKSIKTEQTAQSFQERIDSSAQHFTTVLKEQFTRDLCAARLLSHFGATSFDSDITKKTFLSGFFRMADALVSAAVIQKMVEKDREGPIHVLEVGAGVTYPQASTVGLWGGPWLSRKLATAFDGKIKIEATDLGIDSGDTFCNIKVDPQGILSINRIETDGRRESYRSLEGELRPPMDNKFEKEIFRLTTRNGVSYQNLSDHYPRDSIDVLFMRCSPPLALWDEADTFQKRNLFPSASEVIKHDGIIICEFDLGQREIPPFVALGKRLPLMSDETMLEGGDLSRLEKLTDCVFDAFDRQDSYQHFGMS